MVDSRTFPQQEVANLKESLSHPFILTLYAVLQVLIPNLIPNLIPRFQHLLHTVIPITLANLSRKCLNMLVEESLLVVKSDLTPRC